MSTKSTAFSRAPVRAGRGGFGRLLALAIWGNVLLTGCSLDSVIAPPVGAFPLRAVRVDQGPAVNVPASIPSHANDTVRYVAGSFELRPGRRWRERWERTLVSGDIEQAPQASESSGTYRITERSAGQLTLDLYPGMVMPAVYSPIATVRGDTLFHSAFIYVR